MFSSDSVLSVDGKVALAKEAYRFVRRGTTG